METLNWTDMGDPSNNGNGDQGRISMHNLPPDQDHKQEGLHNKRSKIKKLHNGCKFEDRATREDVTVECRRILTI